MTVRDILDRKGRDVVTLGPDGSIADAARFLAENRIGAVVVSKDGAHIDGILSERDIVRAIASGGAAVLDQPVSSVMTANVKRCRETSTVNEVMSLMSSNRFRHLPVENDGKLVGIISIGDVVKRRIEDIEREADEIRNYIATV